MHSGTEKTKDTNTDTFGALQVKKSTSSLKRRNTAPCEVQADDGNVVVQAQVKGPSSGNDIARGSTVDIVEAGSTDGAPAAAAGIDAKDADEGLAPEPLAAKRVVIPVPAAESKVIEDKVIEYEGGSVAAPAPAPADRSRRDSGVAPDTAAVVAGIIAQSAAVAQATVESPVIAEQVGAAQSVVELVSDATPQPVQQQRQEPVLVPVQGKEQAVPTATITRFEAIVSVLKDGPSSVAAGKAALKPVRAVELTRAAYVTMTMRALISTAKDTVQLAELEAARIAKHLAPSHKAADLLPYALASPISSEAMRQCHLNGAILLGNPHGVALAMCPVDANLWCGVHGADAAAAQEYRAAISNAYSALARALPVDPVERLAVLDEVAAVHPALKPLALVVAFLFLNAGTRLKETVAAIERLWRFPLEHQSPLTEAQKDAIKEATTNVALRVHLGAILQSGVREYRGLLPSALQLTPVVPM
ncbi:hypothetical protein H9P43_005926 [Blastocladiella emersonii ATCC 22665]|nr:hypothetical protein H9P43_005926 [Blastocladiella emersonii ATCC 22665]